MSQSYWFKKSNIAIIKKRRKKVRFSTLQLFLNSLSDTALPDLVIFTRVLKFRLLMVKKNGHFFTSRLLFANTKHIAI